MRKIATCMALAWVVITGCQSAGRLGEYDFPGATLAVVYDFPPHPEVLTGPYFPGHPRDPVHAIIRAGSRIAKEIAAADLRPRLDSAALLVDVSQVFSDRVSTRASRTLRTTLVENEDDADFIFEIRIRDYGISAEDWDAAAHLFVDAEVLLFDAVDGREIWESHVKERDPIMPHIFGPGRARVARDLVTVAAMAGMSVEELARALEGLADYAADRITDRLRDSLEDVR